MGGAGSEKDPRVYGIDPGGLVPRHHSSPIEYLYGYSPLAREEGAGEQAHLESAVRQIVVCCVREG
jgi:hypothetical protein